MSTKSFSDDETLSNLHGPYVMLDALEVPVLVAGRDGAVAHVNPSFARRFGVADRGKGGTTLAAIFDAGARELVLQGLASVLTDGKPVRFCMRVAERGYVAVLSPVEKLATRQGALLLLTEEGDESKLMGLHRGLCDGLDELDQSLHVLLEQTGGRRARQYRGHVEDGLRSIARLRKWADELGALVQVRQAPKASDAATLDAVGLLDRVATRIAQGAELRGVALHKLAPTSLPRVPGDGQALEEALVQWLRSRVAQKPAPASLTLAVKRIAGDGAGTVLLSIGEAPPAGGKAIGRGGEAELAAVEQAVVALRGGLHTSLEPSGSRVTTIRLRGAS
ncbi:MAG TPA: PAS domain-containing protein [Myxococcota bacterium]|nr:PAS domain-containing protein [Myxococcota bacterium]